MVYGHEFVLILRQRNIIQWAGSTPFIERCKSLHFCRPPCECGLLKLSWKPKGMVRFGTDACASEGKDSKQPPPLRPCRCHSRGSFPRLTSVRNSSGIFSRTFPENLRNISNIFRYFVRPLFTGFRDPPKVFRYSEGFSLLFRTFFVIFRTFFGTFRTFAVTFRALSVTPSAPFPVHVRTIALQFLELSMLQSHNLSSLSSEPSINVLWDHPKTSDCSMANQTPMKSEDAISDTSTLTLNEHTTKILKIVWIEPSNSVLIICKPHLFSDKFVRTFFTESNEIWRRWLPLPCFFP